MKACFMGLGYIGLPTAIIAAKHGVQVTGVDINPKVVEMTNQGHLHIVEPGMEEMLQDVVRSGALHASTTPEVSDAYFMVVPTPFKGNHEPDISYVEAATRAVIPLLKEGDLYVIESTSPVGTTDKMAKLIFELRPELSGKIHIAYCPERVLPGNVIYELVHNDCIAVDPYFITADFPVESQLIAKAREINNYKAFWCAEKVENAMLRFELENHRKPTVAMMGLAFKPNIDDLRESPAKYITTKVMQSCNNADILVVEPNVTEHNVFKLTDYREAYDRADIVVFLTAHDPFKTLPRRDDKIILDFCGIYK